MAGNKTDIPGIGEIDNASGFIDLRALKDRASLARAIEIAMMSDPPLVIILTPGQRAAAPPISEMRLSFPSGDENVPGPDVRASTLGGRDNSRGRREVVSISGHPKHDKVLIVEAN